MRTSNQGLLVVLVFAVVACLTVEACSDDASSSGSDTSISDAASGLDRGQADATADAMAADAMTADAMAADTSSDSADSGEEMASDLEVEPVDTDTSPDLADDTSNDIPSECTTLAGLDLEPGVHCNLPLCAGDATYFDVALEAGDLLAIEVRSDMPSEVTLGLAYRGDSLDTSTSESGNPRILQPALGESGDYRVTIENTGEVDILYCLDISADALVEGVDLQAHPRMSAFDASAGDELELIFDVVNRGLSEASGSTAVVSLSQDLIPDDGDTVVDEWMIASMASGARSERRLTYTLPNDLPTGEYTILIEVDATDAVDESDESNNVVGVPVVVP